MPMPKAYQTASRDLDAFLNDLLATSGLSTTNQVYSMTRSVLHVFRRHMPVEDVVHFAGVLPPLLAAILIESWDATRPPVPFPDRATLGRDVKAVRAAHNFATDNAIAEVAQVLRRHVDEREFERILKTLPEPAQAYWAA